MGDWITVTGIPPYDGRYELELDEAPFTTREWGWIKRYAGYVPGTIDLNTYTDPEMITLLAIIAIRRSGTIDTGDVAELWERLADAPFGSTIRLEPGEAGDADGPPASSSNGNPSFSGDSSTTTSESSDEPPSRTGSPASAISASGPPTLVS